METLIAPDSNSNNDDLSISGAILMRFTDPTRQDHLEIRRIIVGMAHAQKVAPTAVAYMEATRSCLYQISSSSETKPGQVEVRALFSILSQLIPKVPPSVLIDKKKIDQLVTDPVLSVLRTQSLNKEATQLGIQCIAQLLDIHRLCNSPWSDARHLFQHLLGFATSPLTWLRKSSALVIGQLLHRFRRSPHFFEAASEALTGLVERWWLPVLSGSNSVAAANALMTRPVVQEYWHVLDFMKTCLVFMSTKFKIAVLSYYKAIFELILERQALAPLITMCLDCSLERICLHPTSDVPPHLLLDLLCLVSISVSRKLWKAHEAERTCSVLKNGVAKVYSSNRGICASKLPLVFEALKTFMGKPEEEDDGYIEVEIDSAADAFKSIIQVCIDQALIKQEPTIVEKLCSIVQSLLDFHRTNAAALSMDVAFEIVLTMFDKLGAYTSYFMRGALESLSHMHKLPDEEFRFRKQATLLLGSLIEEKCGVNDVNIIALLPQEQLMELLADYRGLKSIGKLELSHRKRKEFDVGSVPGRSESVLVAGTTLDAIYGATQRAKKIKL